MPTDVLTSNHSGDKDLIGERLRWNKAHSYTLMIRSEILERAQVGQCMDLMVNGVWGDLPENLPSQSRNQDRTKL